MIRIEKNAYHLQGERYRYCFLRKNGKLLHMYYGQRLHDFADVCETGEVETGNTWTHIGVVLRLEKGDYASYVLRLSVV